jgi:glycine/D-amino acid oxidase-like deaminating enzyme
VLLCLLAKDTRTKQSECKALVVKGGSNSRYRLRPLPAAPLDVRRRYLIVVQKPLPAAPLVVRRSYLIVVPRPLPRCASQVLGRGAQAVSRSAAQVIDGGA